MFRALFDTNPVSLELPAARLATTRQQARPAAIRSVPWHHNASRSVCESDRECARAAVAWSSSIRLQPPVEAIVELVPDRLRQKARATHHQFSKMQLHVGAALLHHFLFFSAFFLAHLTPPYNQPDIAN
jgi:hypothetical protein